MFIKLHDPTSGEAIVCEGKEIACIRTGKNATQVSFCSALTILVKETVVQVTAMVAACDFPDGALTCEDLHPSLPLAVTDLLPAWVQAIDVQIKKGH